MTKIVILGAGSIGCWIGGHLIHGGAQVTLIGRERYARQIEDHGLNLTHFERDAIQCARVDFQIEAAALRGADLIGLCVKSQDTAAAAQDILRYAPNAHVVSFQNGIRNPEILKEYFPAEKIIPAIVPFNVTPTSKGGFHCGTAGPLIVQQADALTPLVSALKNAGQDIEVKGAVLGDQWAKMIVNLNNGLNVLTGRTLHEGFMQREYRLTLADCVEEALEVARLHQIEIGTFNGRSPQALLKVLRLPNFAYRLIMRWIVKMDKKARSSMLDDLEAGRGSEIEYLQGEIVKRAQAVDRLAPKNSAILMAVESAFLKGASPHLSGAELYRLVKKKAPLTQGRVWSKRRQ